jgi:hypothetical protein
MVLVVVIDYLTHKQRMFPPKVTRALPFSHAIGWLFLLLLLASGGHETTAFVSPRPLSTLATLTRTPLVAPIRALPLQVDAIRVLSGAASGEGGMDAGVVLETVKSSTLQAAGWAFGGFTLLVTLLTIGMSTFAESIYSDAAERFREVLQDDYPDKLKAFEEKMSSHQDAFGEDDTEATKLMYVAIMEDQEFVDKIVEELSVKLVKDKLPS